MESVFNFVDEQYPENQIIPFLYYSLFITPGCINYRRLEPLFYIPLHTLVTIYIAIYKYSKIKKEVSWEQLNSNGNSVRP